MGNVIDVETISHPDSMPSIWIKVKGFCLTKTDDDILMSGKELTDIHIKFTLEVM